MSQEEILEGNKLIAEFMGLHYRSLKYYTGWYKDPEFQNRICDYDGLQYHSSWNWLMPVCYKISEIIKDKYNIENLTPLDELFDILSGGLYYTNDDLKVSTNIMEVYSDVITFIKWYNSQQK